MTLHLEIKFEDDICNHLAANGWLYAEKDAQHYDRARALYPADVIAWVQAAQPQAWEALSKNHGANAENTLLDRLRKQLDDRGHAGCAAQRHGTARPQAAAALAQFKPALAMNPDLQTRYAANRLRVIRQVRYSLHNENSIDLVLFLNGIPVATVELKSDFTQSVEDAIDQYRFDRQPKPKGQNAAEPLLEFPARGAGAFRGQQFAKPHDHAPAGTGHHLPAVQSGDHGAAGNPVNPNGHKHRLLVGRSLGAGFGGWKS
jgi:type I restriction enzyme R subunit